MNPLDVNEGNAGEYIHRLSEHVNSLVDALTNSPEDNIAPGSIQSDNILQNSIAKKHSLSPNSSNIIDNAAFEAISLQNSFAIVHGNGAWDRIISSEAYQGDYVARYVVGDQDAIASIHGSGDMGIVDEYNPGVIPASEGEIYTFTMEVMHYNGGTVPTNKDRVTGFIEFRNKVGGVLATHTSTEELPTADDTWTSFTVPNKVAPALTSYILIGIKVAIPATSDDEDAIYYFDGTVLQRDTGVSTSHYNGNQTVTYATKTYPAALTYYDLTAGYGNLVAKDFAESGTPGEIEYTGEPTAKFLVQFAVTARTRVVGKYHYVYLKLLKEPGGTGGFSDVPNATIHDNTYGNWVFYGTMFRFPRCSGFVILELSKGDKLKLMYGLQAISATDITNANFGTDADGFTICITGVSS